ncbi:hypothetical protein M6D81_23090 [Paenibacillus sp. J5C_2022]|uniref:hypothetical protein n=1 Tax=Paenibacillus sp. J5C2022 TaxID=2977129 RepID=UPI0021D21ADA|nr:hypothetical protein [Paenibacillus sp. J5C2022]MCU6711587.1 hypothetical protein [Paenibacillus sp. J5C2022]
MRKRVAAIVTEYRYNSHAEVIVGRMLGEMGYAPRVKVAALYTDQVPDNDTGKETAARFAVPLCPSIADTIVTAHNGGGIDGIVIIGEHGSYPHNGKGQTMYPRRRFLEECLLALDELGLKVPIFCDKHLAYDYDDAQWMYDELKRRGIPFMGGSSIPHVDKLPPVHRGQLRSAKEFLVVSNGDLEGYGFHAMEVLQSLAEQRAGGETGVASVELIGGERGEVWQAMDRGEWPAELLLRAISVYPDQGSAQECRHLDGGRGKRRQFSGEELGQERRHSDDGRGKRRQYPGEELGQERRHSDNEREQVQQYPDVGTVQEQEQVHPIEAGGHAYRRLRESEPDPALFVITYRDGTKGYIIRFRRFSELWGFAIRYGDGEVAAALCDSDLERPFSHFERFTGLIEDFIMTGRPPFPMERTLLTTGVICFGMDALLQGRKLKTPQLHIQYSEDGSRLEGES